MTNITLPHDAVIAEQLAHSMQQTEKLLAINKALQEHADRAQGIAGRLIEERGELMAQVAALTAENAALRERVTECEGLAAWFCARVQRGEFKSKVTYGRFMDFLNRAALAKGRQP